MNPSLCRTFTGKPVARVDNAVTVALKELEVGSGVHWGDLLPSAEDIRAQVQRDSRERSDVATAYSVSRNEVRDERVGVGAGGVLRGARPW